MMRSTPYVAKLKPNFYEFDALGTRWWCESIDGEINDDLRQSINKMVKDFNDKYSRFDQSSLLNQLCIAGYLDNPPKEMIEMLKFARDVYNTTNGLFNISVGGILEKSGYGNGPGANIQQNIWQDTVINAKNITIPKQIRLDFGGFGKGWLIDKLAKLFKEHNVSQFIINGGGDLFVNSKKPVRISLEHPIDTNKSIGSTEISNRGLAVSSTIKRRWQKNGAMHHHIIDPSTKSSSKSDVASVYVKASSALIADTLATVLIIDPSLKQKLEKHYSAQSIIITFDQLS